MSITPNTILTVSDRKGIVVSSWTRGDVFTLKVGERIKVNPNGAWVAAGKVLNVPADVQSKLLAHGRVRA